MSLNTPGSPTPTTVADLTQGQSDFTSSASASRERISPRERVVSPTTDPSTFITNILPHDKVFNIQVGCATFLLSGASLCSDAPSYFSHYFLKQVEEARIAGDDRGCRTLHIDRDPELFKDIARHLQGYHIQIRDPQHFVYLFADAQLFQLPKLLSRLFESEIFVSIGAKSFQIPRDIFSNPGDSPNYFTLGFTVFFSTPKTNFPGLNKEGLLRPPAIAPAEVANRSPEIFGDLIHMLRGYPIEIRNEVHRAALLRDCKYYHLRGLEQRIVPHWISFNPTRQNEEITIRLEDIKPSGIAFILDKKDDDDLMSESMSSTCGSVTYSRPYVDDVHRELLIEIGNHQTLIDGATSTASFVGDTKKRIQALRKIIQNKVNTAIAPSTDSAMRASPTSPSMEEVKVFLDGSCHTIIDGREIEKDKSPILNLANVDELCVKNGIWRIRIDQKSDTGIEVVMHGVKIDVTSSQHAANQQREFLTQ